MPPPPAGLRQAAVHIAQLADKSADSLAVTVHIGLADLSVVDHTPEELFNLALTGGLPSPPPRSAPPAPHCHAPRYSL